MATISLTTTTKRDMATEFKILMDVSYNKVVSGSNLALGESYTRNQMSGEINELYSNDIFEPLIASFSLGDSPSSTVKSLNKIANAHYKGNPLLFKIHGKIRDIYFLKETGSSGNETYTVGAFYQVRETTTTITNDDLQEVIYVQKFEVSF